MKVPFAIVAVALVLAHGFAGAQSRDPFAGAVGAKPPLGPDSYVGDTACAECHRDKVETHRRTAHHLTSALASKDAIGGPFAGPEATMKTRNPALQFRMESKPDGYYQTAVTSPGMTTRSARFDIVTGSGRKGQTYLTWRGNELLELPVSFWVTPAHWINSPGFVDGEANFDRPVTARCLECHATAVRSIAPNQYDRTDLILGITCEKCHAPGGDHVKARRAGRRAGGPPDTIVNTAALSRDKQLELCASCHGGRGVVPKAPAFSYRPGEPFDRYFAAAPPALAAGPAEVHGNQVALLKASRCYQQSAMTCATCHDVHLTQRDVTAMSARCVTCHQPQACGVFKKSGHQIDGKCVDCHMPNQTSRSVSVTTNGATLQPVFRTHLIKVY